MTQVQVVNDSGRKLPKVAPKDGESIHCGKGIYNSAGSSVEMVSKHEDLTQAEEVNDSGQKLPKVSPNDGDSVHFTERNFVRAFKRLP